MCPPTLVSNDQSHLACAALPCSRVWYPHQVYGFPSVTCQSWQMKPMSGWGSISCSWFLVHCAESVASYTVTLGLLVSGGALCQEKGLSPRQESSCSHPAWTPLKELEHCPLQLQLPRGLLKVSKESWVRLSPYFRSSHFWIYSSLKALIFFFSFFNTLAKIVNLVCIKLYFIRIIHASKWCISLLFFFIFQF